MHIIEVPFSGSESPWPYDIGQSIRDRIYILKYASGLLKVGYSGMLRSRWIQHCADARKANDSISRVWFSIGHLNARANEALLVKFCSQRWKASSGRREYFRDGDFDRVHRFAECLEYERVSEEHFKENHWGAAQRLDDFLSGLMADPQKSGAA